MTPGNALYQLFKTNYQRPDPGDAKTIRVNRQFAFIPLVSGASGETRTIAQPTKVGLFRALGLDTDGGGDITLTVTGGYNAAAETTLTFADAHDWLILYSIKVGTSFLWAVLASEGIAELGGGVDVHTLGLLGAAPAISDLMAVADESASGDPTLAITVAELFQTYFEDMTPGTGISTGTNTICEHRVSRVGGLIKTEILIDLTGLNDGGTAGDVIGKDGATANCHIGQIVAAVNGTIIAGRVTCFETPAGGNDDVDIWGTVLEATLAQDTAISAATNESQLINHGAWAAEEVDHLSALPGVGYLYLACGASTDGDYSAGILLIELWGK